jgi:hypothetical protein
MFTVAMGVLIDVDGFAAGIVFVFPAGAARSRVKALTVRRRGSVEPGGG